MITSKAIAALALFAATIIPAEGRAQAFRAYLSSGGVDNPACSLAAPCRLLPAALAAVASGGEIWMLDSANYNTSTVLILKSVTILAVPGALGSVVATGGNAIAVDFPGGNVVLRNLVLVPLPGTGAAGGVAIGRAASVTIDDCLIAGLPGTGIAAQGEVAIRVIGSTIRDNENGFFLQGGTHTTVVRSTISGNSAFGMWAENRAGPGATTVDIADSTLDANGVGLWAYSSSPTAATSVSIRESRVVRSLSNGTVAQSEGGSVSVSLSNNLIASGGIGLQTSGAGSRMWAAGNMISGNDRGIVNAVGATFESAGDNAVRNNNLSQAQGTITPVPRR
jgi:hypothetical protein